MQRSSGSPSASSSTIRPDACYPPSSTMSSASGTRFRSIWLSAFRHIFTLFFLLAVLLATSWKMTLGSVVLLPMVVWPVRTLGKRIRRSTEKIQAGIGELVADFGRDGQRQPGGEGLRDGGFRDRQVSRFGAALAAREHAMDSRGGGHLSAHGFAGRRRDRAGVDVRPRADQDGRDDRGDFRHICLCVVQVLRTCEGIWARSISNSSWHSERPRRFSNTLAARKSRRRNRECARCLPFREAWNSIV